MRSDHWCAIVNPAAGHGKALHRARPVLDALARRGAVVEELITRHPGEAVQLVARAFAQGTRRFLAVGGDGTAHEVLNGLPLSAAERPRLAVLPVGTGNCFGKDVGLETAEQLITAVTNPTTRREVDVVRIVHAGGTTASLNIASFGFSAQVGALTNRAFKGFGAAGYGLAVVASVASLQPQAEPYVLDDGAVRSAPWTLLSICNTQWTGGTMLMAPGARPDDGAFDIVAVGALSRLSLLRTFPSLYSGRHLNHPAITLERARALRFETPRPRDVMVDGEVFRLTVERLEVVPGAIEVWT